MRLQLQRLACLSQCLTSVSRSYSTGPIKMTLSPSASNRILSIQSQVVHGYVGNKAATFPLQCLGYHVDSINTVSLSNHPGYAGGCKGQSINAEQISEITDGLESNDLLEYRAILTGYMRSSDVIDRVSESVTRIKSRHPNTLYVCDPVLGDNGKFYVPEELTSLYKTKLLPTANVITPNLFEAEMLSGVQISSMQTAREACKTFHAMGVKLCILKGLPLIDGKYSVIMSYVSNGANTDALDDADVTMMRYNLDRIERNFAGCGDLFSALCTGLLAHHHHEIASADGGFDSAILGEVLDTVSSLMTKVLELTHESNSKELCIIEAIDAFRGARRPIISGAYASPTSEKSTFIPASTSAGAITRAASRSYVANGKLAGVIFDMDGTLTEPKAIDFKAMYTRIGLTRGEKDILTQVEEIEDPARRAEAHEIIIDEELKGCDRMIIRPDSLAVLRALRSQRIRTAISTRNCDQALGYFLKVAEIDETSIEPQLHRSSLGKINKPDKRIAEHVLQEWEAFADQVWFVGDSVDDMLCGHAAGCKTCLVLTDYNKDLLTRDPPVVDLAVNTLTEFADHIGIVLDVK